MPELVANGPDIPAALMNGLDSGTVIFFCGAGVSMGPGSGLPGFADLVDHVYAANHMAPDAMEREALDDEGHGSHRWRPSFDRALGLLERAGRLGAQALRRTVIGRLSEPPSGQLGTHAALVALSRSELGVRLITTNFDHRFVEAGLEERLVDAAPKLPVPKPHGWSSLVHLHGRIVAEDDGSNLVLTAADFGRAYLTEGWAARFVTELFREFTVVFVGYSVSDPVMSYIVDALAAERVKGARFTTAYAFVDHDGSTADMQRRRDGWRARNIVPILYDERDDHRLLHATLAEWARIRSDPFQARSRIAVNELSKLPAGPDDPVVERVAWALEDPVAAQALANAPPVTNEDDFVKVERWLDMLTEKGLLECDADSGISGKGEPASTKARLVDNGFRSRDPQALDPPRRHLARWIARHLHIPQVIGWVLRNGGCLHPGLRQQVQARLADPESGIPSRLRTLWTVVSHHDPDDPWRLVWNSKHSQAADSDCERRQLEDDVVRSIAPRLVVRPGPAPQRAFQQYMDKDPAPIPVMEACGHLKLIVGDEDSRHRALELLDDSIVLRRHAWTLTEHLELALELAQDDDDTPPNSSWYRPSITAHDQNPNRDDWTLLVDLARDGYFALAETDRASADILLRRWVSSSKPLFKRLAIHALAENARSDIHLARRPLVAGRKPGVWEVELRREVLRFFRLAGARLPRSLRVEVVRAIHAGSKTRPAKASADFNALIHREKALRLHKLMVSGARLDKASRALAEEAGPIDSDSAEDRTEFISWHGEARWVAQEEFAPKRLLEGSLPDAVAALEAGEIGFDEFRGFVLVQPVKAVRVLRRVANRGGWPQKYWQGFLWSLADLGDRRTSMSRLREHVVLLLSHAPGELFAGVGPAVGGLLRELAEQYGLDREPAFGALWTKAWSGVGGNPPETGDAHDPLTDALNDSAGKLAEAALIRLSKHGAKVGGGIPAAVRAYFDAISADPDGRLGRVMLATRLHYLFSVDPDWVEEHLIRRLDPCRSEEAGDLWYAYGWSPTIGPDLLQAFKKSFLDVLCDSDRYGLERGKLTSLFMAICLEAPSELSAQEIRRVADSMSEEALKTALGCLKQRLQGDASARARIWNAKLHPWLREYWPKVEVRNTSQTSRAMLNMMVECGDAFPDAVQWSLAYLRPLDGHGLHRLGANECAEKHPQWLLRVLERVIVQDVLPFHQRHTLREILDKLQIADAGMAADARFQGLYRIATR